MDYLFLHRDKRTFTSERQKNLLFKTAHLYWEQKFANQGVEKVRRVDCEIYKYVLYYLEVRQVFLDPKLSLKKLSEMIETNQTYLSNVIFRLPLERFGEHISGGICQGTASLGQVSAGGIASTLRIPVAKCLLCLIQ